MIIHIVTPIGREQSIAGKLLLRAREERGKFTLLYDKQDNKRYNKGFILAKVEIEDRLRVNEILNISDILATKEISVEESQARYYLPIDPSTARETKQYAVGTSYQIKVGPFESLSITLTEVNPDNLKGIINLFGRETLVTIEYSAL